MQSLVGRIVFLHLIVLAIVTGAVLVSVHAILNHTLAVFEHRELGDRAELVAQAVAAGFRDGERLDLRSGGFEYAVADARGRLVAVSPKGRMLERASSPSIGAPVYISQLSGNAPYFSGRFVKAISGKPYRIDVIHDLADPAVYADDIVRVFLKRIVWVLVPIALVMMAVDVVLMQRTLRPVITASRRARAIRPGRIDVRLPQQGLPAEIEPLVRAVNEAFDRLELGMRQQREFTADVAHELRTPLSVLRLRADKVADPALAALLRADIEAMSRLTGQLLALAELETFTLAADERADLCAVARDMAGLLAPGAIAAGVEIELRAPEAPVWVHGHADSLFRALRNLVENAIAHSPAAGVITIDVLADGRVRVSDQGPGILPADRERIFRRGWRRDRQGAGHGLGLGIVGRIVAAHNGAIEVEAAPGGGASFVMQLRSGEGRSV